MNRRSGSWSWLEPVYLTRSLAVKILLDHNLDWRLARYLPEHEVNSTLSMGWDTFKNGALLSQAETRGFSAMLTADKGIKSQQKIENRLIAVVILRANNTRLKTQLEMIPDVVEILTAIRPGQIVEDIAAYQPKRRFPKSPGRIGKPRQVSGAVSNVSSCAIAVLAIMRSAGSP